MLAENLLNLLNWLAKYEWVARLWKFLLIEIYMHFIFWWNLVSSIQLISFLAECSALDYHGTSRRLFVGLDDGAISVSAYESCLAQADNDQQYIHYCENP